METPVEPLTVPVLMRRYNEGSVNDEQLLVMLDELLNEEVVIHRECARELREE